MRNLYDLARQEDTTLLQKIEQEDELVEKLGYLRLHLDDENLVQEVLMMLRKVRKKQPPFWVAAGSARKFIEHILVQAYAFYLSGFL